MSCPDPDDRDDQRRIQDMHNALESVAWRRRQAKALEHLGMLLSLETPGTVTEVTVKGHRWWRRTKKSDAAPAKEIILTDDERRAFRDWCDHRVREMHQQADELELKAANGKAGR